MCLLGWNLAWSRWLQPIELKFSIHVLFEWQCMVIFVCRHSKSNIAEPSLQTSYFQCTPTIYNTILNWYLPCQALLRRVVLHWTRQRRACYICGVATASLEQSANAPAYTQEAFEYHTFINIWQYLLLGIAKAWEILHLIRTCRHR